MDNIKTSNLTKKFGSFTAVHDISFTLKEGEICAMVGENGAGKTTFLKLLIGLLAPTSGSVEICGIPIDKNPIEAKTHVGYIPDNPEAYSYLSGEEFLNLTGKLRNMEKKEFDIRMKELVPLFPLAPILKTPMSQYSRGNKQKVAFLASILTRPDVLIIDEPIVGLDPASIETLGKTLVSYVKSGKSVLFVTHIIEFAKAYASRTITMNHGRLV